MPMVPLAVRHQQLSESCWIFCPEVLLSQIPLAEEPAIVVEVDEAMLNISMRFSDGMVPEEVAVRVGPKDAWVIQPSGARLSCCLLLIVSVVLASR